MSYDQTAPLPDRTPAPMTANDIIRGLTARRQYLERLLAEYEVMAAELSSIMTALLALGEQTNANERALVCDWPNCTHVPFATQRALTRHRNAIHKAPLKQEPDPQQETTE